KGNPRGGPANPREGEEPVGILDRGARGGRGRARVGAWKNPARAVGRHRESGQRGGEDRGGAPQGGGKGGRLREEARPEGRAEARGGRPSREEKGVIETPQPTSGGKNA